eukprot:TRINITY_DN12391_c1_g1_i4.p2 TRINITY_DN12391_c1_g1~~TRINITY_DN12391_c1_g1_i4.p2  ORF type:complete len:214 (+),score=44.39 TRINITY_DN12391_c1_g1_i4:516-1157(+)
MRQVSIHVYSSRSSDAHACALEWQRQLSGLLSYTPAGRSAPFEGSTNTTALRLYEQHVHQLDVTMLHGMNAILNDHGHSTVIRRYGNPDDANRLVMVSGCTMDLVDVYCDIHVQAMDMYCRKYGLDYIQIRADLDPARLNPWVKVMILRLVLEKSPLVMWIDSDVMIRDMEWNVSAFVAQHMKADVDVLTASDMVSCLSWSKIHACMHNISDH